MEDCWIFYVCAFSRFTPVLKGAEPMASQVTLFADTNFQGTSLVITEAVADLSQLGFNDKASSAIVEGETWTFYLDVNYQGMRADLSPGRYEDLGLKALNDSLSSLRSTGSQTSDSSTGSRTSGSEGYQQVVFVQPPSYH
jgi:hypothetical protein